MSLRPRRYDLIVFDWDGTLYDSTALIVRCIQAACKDLGVAVPNDRDASFVIGLALIDALRGVNEALWDIEDNVRDCERQKDFGTRFVELARGVYHQNDRRAALKRELNDLLGSDLVEEKSYQAY